jgi:hypothetical protein
MQIQASIGRGISSKEVRLGKSGRTKPFPSGKENSSYDVKSMLRQR